MGSMRSTRGRDWQVPAGGGRCCWGGPRWGSRWWGGWLLLRGAAVACAMRAVAAVAFPAGADALVYWANARTDTIGRANLDGTDANQSFIHVAGDFPQGGAVDDAHVYGPVPVGNTIGRANLDGTGPNQRFITG